MYSFDLPKARVEICVDFSVIGSDGTESVCYDENPRSFGW